ncbi:MAG: peptidoglycan recognition family protein [Isosphaeraceae bacterium]
MPFLASLCSLALITFAPADDPKPGAELARKGDEIVVAGRLFHTTTPVVLWSDPGGYDAYRPERRFVPMEKATWKEAEESGIKTPNRYGARTRGMTPEQVEGLREGIDLARLQEIVDQFVIHYDVCGISRTCFRVLHDERCLSVHFMLDIDGTIYQTLDLKESAWHATIANGRSIGIEIANMGSYSQKDNKAFQRWYGKDTDGKVKITVPGGLEAGHFRNLKASFAPIRNELVEGNVQGQDHYQYDFTPEQYEALTRLTATLCAVFPRITCDYPKDASGKLIPKKLPDDQYAAYHGVLGHYHVQTNKTDPGPAFQWDRVVGGAKKLLGR